MTKTPDPTPRSDPATPVFLEPRTYRRRRLMDAARMLPVLGVVLWMVPLLWPTGPDDVKQRVPTSSAMIYVFVVWAGLICVAAGIWLKTRGPALRVPRVPDPDDDQPDRPG